MNGAGPNFVVLTGFLGSGKTTLLRDLLAGEAGRDTAVVVNEVGEIGLDGALLAEGNSGVPLAMLANGCICCEPGSDLLATVAALLSAERPASSGPLRRIVLETSGLSKPGPVLRQLAGLASYRMQVSVVATYDALRGPAVQAYEEASAQWAGAHRIVITKADAVSPDRLRAAHREAGIVNPLASIVATPKRAEAVESGFAPAAGASRLDLDRIGAASAGAHPRIVTRLVRQRAVLGYDDLAAWLDNLAGALGERLLRIKGLVRVRELGPPLLIQSVGTLFSQPRPFPDPEAGSGFLVLIARDLADGEIEAVPPSLPLLVAPLRHGLSRAGTPIRLQLRADGLNV